MFVGNNYHHNFNGANLNAGAYPYPLMVDDIVFDGLGLNKCHISLDDENTEISRTKRRTGYDYNNRHTGRMVTNYDGIKTIKISAWIEACDQCEANEILNNIKRVLRTKDYGGSGRLALRQRLCGCYLIWDEVYNTEVSVDHAETEGSATYPITLTFETYSYGRRETLAQASYSISAPNTPSPAGNTVPAYWANGYTYIPNFNSHRFKFSICNNGTAPSRAIFTLSGISTDFVLRNLTTGHWIRPMFNPFVSSAYILDSNTSNITGGVGVGGNNVQYMGMFGDIVLGDNNFELEYPPNFMPSLDISFPENYD